MATAQTPILQSRPATDVSRAELALLPVVVKTIITHTVTYSLMGWLALLVMDYAGWYSSNMAIMMRPLTDPLLILAPLFQPIRGALFGLIIYLLREPLLERKNGWLMMWAMFVVVGILGTFGPTPGSLEGMFFTVFPFIDHLRGLPEVILQSFLLSFFLYYWVNHPEKRWLTWAMVAIFIVMMLLPILGVWATGLQ